MKSASSILAKAGCGGRIAGFLVARTARGLHREAHTARQPRNREPELQLAFEPAMPEEMRVDRPVGPRKIELWRQQVFKLFPHLCSIHFCVVHRFVLSGNREVDKKRRVEELKVQ